jgi:hypothetical protein
MNECMCFAGGCSNPSLRLSLSLSLSLVATLRYLMELSISAYNMVGFLPSEIAAASIYLAHAVMAPGSDAWSKNLEHYAGYTYSEVERCIKEMTDVVVKSVTIKQQAVRRKYASSKLHKISELPELEKFIAERS